MKRKKRTIGYCLELKAGTKSVCRPAAFTLLIRQDESFSKLGHRRSRTRLYLRHSRPQCLSVRRNYNLLLLMEAWWRQIAASGCLDKDTVLYLDMDMKIDLGVLFFPLL